MKCLRFLEVLSASSATRIVGLPSRMTRMRCLRESPVTPSPVGVNQYAVFFDATQLLWKVLAAPARTSNGASFSRMRSPVPLLTFTVHWIGVPSGTVKSPWFRWSMSGKPVYPGGVACTRRPAKLGMAKGVATCSSERQPFAKN